MHVAIVQSPEPAAGSSTSPKRHYFVLAWRLLPQYAQSLMAIDEALEGDQGEEGDPDGEEDNA